jgi:hypothetical protein
MVKVALLIVVCLITTKGIKKLILHSSLKNILGYWKNEKHHNALVLKCYGVFHFE